MCLCRRGFWTDLGWKLSLPLMRIFLTQKTANRFEWKIEYWYINSFTSQINIYHLFLVYISKNEKEKEKTMCVYEDFPVGNKK